MNSHRKKGARGHRMFTRVFLHGLLLIAVVTVASALIFHLFGQPQHWREMIDRMATLIADDLGPEGSEQTALVKRLEEIHLVTGVGIAVYRVDCGEIASAGDQTPPPISESEALSLLQEGRSRHYSSARWAIPLPVRAQTPRAYLLAAKTNTGGISKVFILLAIVVVLVAVLSIPLVHAITRPLKRLTETARKLASGDLTARTEIVLGGEVGILAETMDEMADGLARRIRAEKELLANVSHEIRSPLARINVALELCAEESSTETEIKKHLEGIADDVTDLERLVDDVLTAARLDLTADSNEESKLVPRTERIDLFEIA
ncbi:MAG: HAMP domain-containing protein, partial [Deltaproteobacteria bacterium]|nr:HAMP domain-containing protein [Deltaproteobacteria bacterium]